MEPCRETSFSGADEASFALDSIVSDSVYPPDEVIGKFATSSL